MNDNKVFKKPSGIIAPIEFSPNTEKASRVPYKFKIIHLITSLIAVVFGIAGWFVLTAKSVFIEVDPVTANVNIKGGFNIRMGQRYLIRSGPYELEVNNEGYHDITRQITVSDAQSQTYPVKMRRLPGIINIDATDIPGARVQVDGIDVGVTPLADLSVEPGEHTMSVSLDRYFDYSQVIVIEGRQLRQEYNVILEPAWATAKVSTNPSGADILVDGDVLGKTPFDVEVLEGRRDITLKLAGYKAWRDEIQVVAGADFVISEVKLEPADGMVFVRSSPSAASVTIGGDFKGVTPLEVALTPGKEHEITFFKSGYQSQRSIVRPVSGEESEFEVSLDPVLADVNFEVFPDDAELYVNDEYRGPANKIVSLMAVRQKIEIRKEGYEPYETEFTSRPGLEQAIKVTLKSLEQVRLEQIEPTITTIVGQDLKLFYPGAFTMGASRREPGRRPNENLRDIQLERAFYFGLREVTNSEYRNFSADHSSGTVSGVTLNNERQPAVQLSWTEAALFCNWLSEQETLPLFYQVEDERVVGINAESTGYRLPTEAEWAWVSRTNGGGITLKYPWGDFLPPPENAGNFADITAENYLGEIMFNYNDNYFASAPVGVFNPNYYEIYDLAGNVSEWVHDYYGAVGSSREEIDPLGPELGQFHTIRGSSWAHGAVTEMRLSFRDFGEEPRDDVGFRIARYLDEP